MGSRLEARVGDWLHVTVEDGTSGHVAHSWARVERVTKRAVFTRCGSYSIATGVAYSAGSADGCVVVRAEIVSAPGLQRLNGQ